MAVFLGEQGAVELRRTGSASDYLSSDLDPSDVNVTRKRFSFDFPSQALISGDRLLIATADGSNLQLVAGHNFPDGAWYVHVDDAGGVRLYANFDDAINGGIETALDLQQPSATQRIFVVIEDEIYRCLGQMRSWQITTTRETVDITTLGENFRRSYTDGLISGQGSVTCIWDYKKVPCDPLAEDIPDRRLEEPNYLAQLVLRLREGANFLGRFYISAGIGERQVWWEAECVVTNVGLSFSPGQVVDATVEFVMTGPIALRVGTLPGYLLQENTDFILLEDGQSRIELEDSD